MERLIIGWGNPIASDNGFGWRVEEAAREIARQLIHKIRGGISVG